MFTIAISLREPAQLFSSIGIDPRAVDYDEYAVRPAIETVRDILVADPPSGDQPIELLLSLPRDHVYNGLDADLTAAVRRWAGAEHAVDARRSRAAWASARRMTVAVVLLFALVQVVMVGLQRAATAVDNDIVAAIAEGVSVVGWVLLWFPIEAYLLERSRRAERNRSADMFGRLVVRTQSLD